MTLGLSLNPKQRDGHLRVLVIIQSWSACSLEGNRKCRPTYFDSDALRS